MHLWNIENSQVYFLPTLHVFDVPTPPLTEQAANVLKVAEQIIFESDWKHPPSDQYMILPEGTTLEELIPSDLYLRLVERWQSIPKARSLPQTPLWIVTNTLSINQMERNGIKLENGIDNFIRKRTRADMGYLETQDEAAAPLANGPIEERIKLLQILLDDVDRPRREGRKMVNGWKQRDKQPFLTILEDAYSIAPITFSDAIQGRNRKWLDRILSIHSEGRTTLIAVGMLHFLGANNLTHLLAEKGLKLVELS